MRIREATPEDVPLIMRLIGEFAAFERLAHDVSGDEDQLHEHLFGPDPAARVLLAHVDDEPAGFALWFRSFSTFLTRPGLYLEDLYVREPYRGQGVGTALLRALAAIAVERGLGRVEWSVLDWNEPAIGFYRSIGASSMDGWTTFRLTGDPLCRFAAGTR
jgi:GNAT superfamily N-acetyltransferase